MLVLFALLGSSSSYHHAFYELEVRQPLATVLAFSALALGVHAASRFVTPDWERLLTIVARTALLLVNLGFWVGSLRGYDLDWLTVPHRSIPDVAFSAGWAVCLLAAAVWAGWTNRRWMLNLVAVFGSIHFYTQWYEHLGGHAGQRAGGRCRCAAARDAAVAAESPARGGGLSLLAARASRGPSARP